VKKVLFVVPHLSTGGLPQYTLSLIKKIKDKVDVYCIEYSMLSPTFIVQRNQIIELLGDKFYCLEENKQYLNDLIHKINPDIIHLQEMPEFFMANEVADILYSVDRTYKIVETSHDSSFNSSSKRFFPDYFALISEYQRKEFSKLNIPITLVEYDIEYKNRANREEILKKLGLDPNIKHILNVGLFTPRKNQAEIFEYAKKMIDQPVQFHFLGNQADNFYSYWEPLLRDKPNNVKIWGERNDVDIFYSCMDLFLFTSRGTDNDKETSPLVIREAIGHQIPSLIYNLPVYLGMYDKYDNITYLDFKNLEKNINLIKEKLNLLDEKNYLHPFETLYGPVDLSSIDYPNTMYEAMVYHGEAAAMWWGAFIHKELDRSDVKIEHGDIFVDLGANIGVSSYYALKHGAKKVYCFEPDQKVLSLLEKNIKRDKETFNYAISNERSELELYHWPYNDIHKGPKYTVKCIKLEDVFDLVKEPVIDYLKIDIEGFEENIFDDISQDTIHRVKKMFIEYHNGENTQSFVEKIQKLGFSVRVEYGNGQNYIYCYNKNFKIMDEKSVAITISTYSKSQFIKEKTIECVNAIKKYTEYPVICTDHNSAEKSIIDCVDYYFYDANNVLTTHTFYDTWWMETYDAKILVKLRPSKNNGYHGSAVHQNIFAGISLANMLKYDYVVFMNFDVILDDIDSKRLIECVNRLKNSDKSAFFLMTNEMEGNCLKTVFFITKPKFYLDKMENITNVQEYENLVIKHQSESNGLENLYYNILKNNLDEIIIENMSELDFFNSSYTKNTEKKSFTSSQTEYSAILPIENSKDDNNVVLFYKSQNDLAFDYKWEVYSQNNLIVEHFIPAFKKEINSNEVFTDTKFFKCEIDKQYDIFLKIVNDDSVVKKFTDITIEQIKEQGTFQFK